MLRIDETAGESGGRVVLRLEGKLSGKWVGELAEAATAALTRNGDLTLDLSGLSFADGAGTALLSSLVAGGTRLINCSLFAAAQLRDADIDCKVE